MWPRQPARRHSRARPEHRRQHAPPELVQRQPICAESDPRTRPYDGHTSQPGQGSPGSRLAIWFSSISRGSSFARGRLSVGHEGAGDIGVRPDPGSCPGKQGFQHGGNSRGPRSSRSRQELKRFARSVIVFCSVNSVVLPVSSVLKPLLSALRTPPAKECAYCTARPEDDGEVFMRASHRIPR
jgi:hypothetical protein